MLISPGSLKSEDLVPDVDIDGDYVAWIFPKIGQNFRIKVGIQRLMLVFLVFC